MADQQLIEIAKALSVDANVLILDEPTASLSAHEVERLFTIVRGLRDRGVAMLFVSHRLGEVFDLCDTRDRAPRRQARHHHARRSDLTTADLIRHMVGPDGHAVPQGRDARSATSCSRSRACRGSASSTTSSFAVRAGEIVGMAGPRGRRADRGRPGAVRDRPARRRRGPPRRQARQLRTPSEAMNAGIAYLPEDRHQEGLVLDFSIAENVTLPILSRLFPRFLVRAGDRARGRPRLHGAVRRAHDRRRPGWSARCRAATSRRSCSPSGSPRSRRS